MPTDTLLRMVESNDTSTHLAASGRLVVRADHAIDDRLAVFRLAGLDVGRVRPGLDEVAFGVDAEQARLLARDLAADDERGVEGDLARLQRRAVAALDVAHGIGHHVRDVEHRARVPQRGRSSPGSAPRCLSRLTIACVPARLPELRSTSTRSPLRSNTVILQNLAMLSTPALVRESEAKIMPSSRFTPMQYVTFVVLSRDCGLPWPPREIANAVIISDRAGGGNVAAVRREICDGSVADAPPRCRAAATLQRSRMVVSAERVFPGCAVPPSS